MTGERVYTANVNKAGELELNGMDPCHLMSFTIPAVSVPGTRVGDVIPITFTGYPDAGAYFEVTRIDETDRVVFGRVTPNLEVVWWGRNDGTWGEDDPHTTQGDKA